MRSKEFKDGGFKMISIKEFIMSLKLVMMKNIILKIGMCNKFRLRY